MKKTIIAALITSTLSLSAYAQNNLNLFGEEEVKPVKNYVKNKTKKSEALITSDVTVAENSIHFFQIGQPSEIDNEMVDGVGKGITLLLALQQLTPNGWVVAKLDNINVKQKINWKGGTSWYHILKDVAHKNKFDLLINWNNKTISIAKDGFIKNMKNGEFNNGAEKNVFEMDSTPQSTMSVPVSNQKRALTPSFQDAKKTLESQKEQVSIKENSIALKKWSVDGKLTLKENIEKIAKESGFSVIWNTKDYQETDRVIEASPTFDADDGVIQQFAVDYGPDSNVELKLAFEFWNNKTLVVKEWKAR